MEREIGKYNRATGIIRGEELWVGDIINCRVLTTSETGGSDCLHIEGGTVLWDTGYGMYVVEGRYQTGISKYHGIFPLHKIMKEDVVFLTKSSRNYGNQKDIIFAIVGMMKSYVQEPVDISHLMGPGEDGDDAQSLANTVTYDMLDTIVGEIASMGVIPKEEINAAFTEER